MEFVFGEGLAAGSQTRRAGSHGVRVQRISRCTSTAAPAATPPATVAIATILASSAVVARRSCQPRMNPLLRYDRIDPDDPIETSDPAEPNDSTLPADPTERSEPVDPIEQIDPDAATDEIDANELTERIEHVDAIESIDR